MFIDSHCHLDFSQFDEDRPAVLKQCHQLGISKIVIPGTRVEHFNNQLNLANKYPQLRNAFGLHPFFLDDFDDSHLKQLTLLLEQQLDSVVALGEIGLDKAISVDWKTQVEVFEKQVELAEYFKLPIILHARKSHNEIIQILKKRKFRFGGVVHAFSGSVQEAKTYIDQGFAIGVGGGITYPRANKTREAIKQLPLSSLVLETDAPDMPLKDSQGKRNTPTNIPKIFEALLTLRKEPQDEVKTACFENVKKYMVNI